MPLIQKTDRGTPLRLVTIIKYTIIIFIILFPIIIFYGTIIIEFIAICLYIYYYYCLYG